MVLDAHDPSATAQFWHAATGWTIGEADARRRHPDGTTGRQGTATRHPRRPRRQGHEEPGAPRRGAVGVDDQAAEVARLETAGATRVDMGQGPDVTWVVLADPEGNEFCVLSPRDE